MEYVYAALLLHKLGKPIEEAGMRKILEAAGANADESKIKSLVASLKGVDIDAALKEAVAMPVAAAPAHAGAAQAEKKKEEAQQEDKREEAAAEGLSALFG